MVLAPMAGITNAAFRQLCREQPGRSARGSTGPSVCLRDDHFARARGAGSQDAADAPVRPGERVRSVQLYGVDPAIMARATEILCNEYGVDHVDLNFGCPVPKVTRKGGGAALPYKRDRLRMILTATVHGGRPVRRTGDDEDPDRHRPMITRPSWMPAGSPRTPAARPSHCTAGPHSRRTPVRPTGTRSASLKEHVSIPVLGNGDIWEAADALRMIRQTGVDGVVDRTRLPRPALALPRPGRCFRGPSDPDTARTSVR